MRSPSGGNGRTMERSRTNGRQLLRCDDQLAGKGNSFAVARKHCLSGQAIGKTGSSWNTISGWVGRKLESVAQVCDRHSQNDPFRDDACCCLGERGAAISAAC